MEEKWEELARQRFTASDEFVMRDPRRRIILNHLVLYPHFGDHVIFNLEVIQLSTPSSGNIYGEILDGRASGN